jgi:hypothetical protein
MATVGSPRSTRATVAVEIPLRRASCGIVMRSSRLRSSRGAVGDSMVAAMAVLKKGVSDMKSTGIISYMIRLENRKTPFQQKKAEKSTGDILLERPAGGLIPARRWPAARGSVERPKVYAYVHF